MAERTAAAEWRAAWPLPLVVMLLMSGSSVVIYTAGVFMPIVTMAFGWTRAAFSSGFMVSTFMGLVAMPLAGRLADRFGPRPMALVGIVALTIATATLGLADGILWHWWLTFLLYAVAGAAMAPSVLTAAVVSRFQAARGLALAVSLSGTGLAAAIWPPLATLYIAALGWRGAIAALVATWAFVAFPLAVMFFHESGADRPWVKVASYHVPGRTAGYAQAIKSRAFLCIGLGGTLFAFAGVAILVNIVPILRDRGTAPGIAASVAATAGVSAMAGRILIGFLLDRMPARTIAVAAFLLPALAAGTLLIPGGSVPLAVVAAVLLGLGLGAELDVATFLAARYFGLDNFSGVFGIVIAFYGVAAGVAPVLASIVYDRSGSYTPLLLAAIPPLIASTVLAALLPPVPRDGGQAPAAT